MRFLKKSFVLALAVVVCLLPVAAESTNMRIEMVVKSFQSDFWKTVRRGAEKAGEDLGVTIRFSGPDNESAIAQQVNMLKTAIDRMPAAICLAALDTNASLEALRTAKTKRLPIVGFDSGVPGAPEGTIVANAATDNYAAGGFAAEKMLEALKPKLLAAQGEPVRIGVITQEPNSDSIVKRTAGFADKMVALLEALPEIGTGHIAVIGHDKFANGLTTGKIIIEVHIPTDVSDNAGTTEALDLLNQPGLMAVFASNEFAAKCLIKANEGLNKLGKDNILAVGFDSGALQLAAIKNGVFLGAVTQDPISIGYNAIMLAVVAAKGQPATDVSTDCLWYNAANMRDPDIASCLYE